MHREVLTGHESAKKIEQNWTIFEIRAIYLDGGGHFVYVVFVLSAYTPVHVHRHACICTAHSFSFWQQAFKVSKEQLVNASS